MRKQELQITKHDLRIGQECTEREPNVTEDTIFTVEGEPVAFYVKEVKGEMRQALEYANREFRSKRVPKSEMRRSSGMKGGPEVRQYSTILGYVPPKPNMGRNYDTISSVHEKKSAHNFIRAMAYLADMAAKKIEEVCPKIWKEQLEQMKLVAENQKLHKGWTSSISNYNIAARYHRDTANITGSLNVIWIMKQRATGGHLHVPDYGLVLEGGHRSMIVYPAWRDMHGVTPIHETDTDGYRNSLVLYALKAAQKS